MGEDHVGILLSLHFHLVEVTEGDAEDDAAALTHQGVHSSAHLGVVLGNLVHDDQLGLGIHAQLLHGLGDAGVMGIGVAGGVAFLVDIDGAHLKVGIAGLGAALAAGTAAGAAAAAGSQAQDHGKSQYKCENLLHVQSSSLFSHSFPIPLFY